MKTNLNPLQTRIFCAVALGIGSSLDLAAATKNSADTPSATAAIPWSQLDAKTGTHADFSDANWSSMGGIPGVNGRVFAAAVDGSGKLYIGGSFNVAGEVIANCVAKWDGSSWMALGSGLNETVFALAVSGSDLNAAGAFTTAGEKASAYVARAYLPALPMLSVLRTSDNVMVSWPTVNTASFALEQAGPLADPPPGFPIPAPSPMTAPTSR